MGPSISGDRRVSRPDLRVPCGLPFLLYTSASLVCSRAGASASAASRGGLNLTVGTPVPARAVPCCARWGGGVQVRQAMEASLAEEEARRQRREELRRQACRGGLEGALPGLEMAGSGAGAGPSGALPAAASTGQGSMAGAAAEDDVAAAAREAAMEVLLETLRVSVVSSCERGPCGCAHHDQ